MVICNRIEECKAKDASRYRVCGHKIPHEFKGARLACDISCPHMGGQACKECDSEGNIIGEVKGNGLKEFLKKEVVIDWKEAHGRLLVENRGLMDDLEEIKKEIGYRDELIEALEAKIKELGE